MKKWLQFIEDHADDIARIIYKIKKALLKLEIENGDLSN